MHLDGSNQDPTAAHFSVLLLPVSQPSCTAVSEQLGTDHRLDCFKRLCRVIHGDIGTFLPY